MANKQDNHDGQITRIIEMLNSRDVKNRMNAMKNFRKLLKKKNCNIEEIIQSGIVSKIVAILQVDIFIDLRIEASLSLVRVASGTTAEIKTVVDAGGIPILIKLISCQRQHLQSEAVFALINIMESSLEYRDLVLKEGILVPLLRFLWQSEGKSDIMVALLALLILSQKSNPACDYEELSLCLPVLTCMLFHDDSDVVLSVCCVLIFVTEGPISNIGIIFDLGVYKRLAELLTHPEPYVAVFALGTLVTVTNTDDSELAHIVIDLLPLPKLVVLLNSPNDFIFKLTCLIINNVFAKGTNDQKRAVNDAGIFTALIDLIDKREINGKNTSSAIMLKIMFSSTDEQLKYLVSQGIIPLLVKMLADSDIENLQFALCGLSIILRLRCKAYTGIFKAWKGFDRVARLRNHSDDGTRKLAVAITSNYFLQEHL